MNAIKAVLFDLDQTLLDRKSALKLFLNWQINFFQLTTQANRSQLIDRFIELDQNGHVWKDVVYQKLVEEFELKAISHQALLESYIADFNKFACSFPFVHSAIRNLKQHGYLLGLISNGKTPFQEHNFYALGLSEYFSSIVVSEAVKLRKPDPAIFKLACQQLNVLPEVCVFIGDNEAVDILGAQHVGMKTIFFHPDTHITSKLADANLHHYPDLEALLHQLSVNTMPENAKQ